MVTCSLKDYSSFTSRTNLTSLHADWGCNRKIHKKIKFTWLLTRLHESMNKNARLILCSKSNKMFTTLSILDPPRI